MDNVIPAYHLLSSTRYDDALLSMDWNTRANAGQPSPYMLLPYHFDRLMAAAKDHGWQIPQQVTRTTLLEECERVVSNAHESHGKGALKLRILLEISGALTVTASPAVPLATPDFLIPSSDVKRVIYIDTEPTPASLFTRTKTTQRMAYDAARARAGLTPLPTPDTAHVDVLLYAPDGLVTETSIRNVAFKRGDAWITPRAGSGCLAGVVRRLLLDEGRIVEGDIYRSELQADEVIMTFNSVEGCHLARLASL